jgi:hypothetical protein
MIDLAKAWGVELSDEVKELISEEQTLSHDSEKPPN